MKCIIRSVRCLSIAMCMTIFTACISQTDKKTKTSEVDLSTIISNTTEKVMKTDYLPIPLYRLIGMADLVVAGTINSVQDSSFTFQISNM